MIIKKSWVIIPILVLIAATTYSQEAEIKKVIANETDSYFKKDLAGFLSSYAEDASTARVYVSVFGYFTETGWDSIKAGATRNFQENPKPITVQYTTDSFMIRRDGSVAVVDYKQHMQFTNSPSPFNKAESWEHRVMVKKNGKWKIATQSTTDLTAYGDAGSEMSLNAVGYKYLYAGKMDEAIQVLSLNAKLHPDSFNVWDSLGEAYTKAGQKEQAIQNYEKSLQIYPENESGKKALQTLKQ